MPLFLSNGSKFKKTDLIEVMRLYNITELEDIPIKEDCSSHIYIHQTLFESLVKGMPSSTSVCFVKLTNAASQHVYCNVFGSHTKHKSAIYAPQWILVALENDHSAIILETVNPTKCSGLILQPHTSIPFDILRAGIENYSCLRAGGTYKIWNPGTSGDKNYSLISVIETLPHSFDYVCILNCDINLELRKALDALDTSNDYKPYILNAKETPKQTDWSKLGNGHILENVENHTKNTKELAYLAAMERLKRLGKSDI